MRKLTFERGLLALIVVVLLGLVSASMVRAGALDTSPSDNRKQAVESRNAAFNRAKSLIPDPQTKNFPLRKMLRDMTEREDMIHHPWFIYILGDNGNVIGYYVGKTVPINGCDFLSSTEDVWTNDKGSQKMQSPSYDGIYYGNSDCNVWVFEDAATNAVIKIGGMKFYVADQPLKLASNPVQIRVTPK